MEVSRSGVVDVAVVSEGPGFVFATSSDGAAGGTGVCVRGATRALGFALSAVFDASATGLLLEASLCDTFDATGITVGGTAGETPSRRVQSHTDSAISASVRIAPITRRV